MLGVEGSGGADAAQSVFTNYVKSADTAQPVPTSIYCIHEKASCRNEIISEPLPHKADPTEHSWRGVLWCCKDRLCRVRWFYVKAHPVGNVPPERFQNIGSVSGTQGGAVLFAPPSKSYRFSHPPSPCAKSMAQGISLSADSDLEGTCPLRESILHLGVCRLRRQIFREMKGKAEEILCGFPSIFLKYLGKDASKMCANRCKTDSKTSPAALSWSSLFGDSFSKLFCFCTMVFAVCALKYPDNFPLLKSADTARRVPTAHTKHLANRQRSRFFLSLHDDFCDLFFCLLLQSHGKWGILKATERS